MSKDALDRVAGRLPEEAHRVLASGLAPTDLQTLLLSVARERAAQVRPASLLRRWRSDRFVQPADADPRALSALEARLWQLLPEGFDGVELSPLAPLGTCSAVGPTNQNRVVSTVRGCEVVSDPTTVLALEAAARRREQPATGRVDLAGCHRVVRAQRFEGPGMSAHFRLLALVSSARDTRSGRTEAALLTDHLRAHAVVLGALLPAHDVLITLSCFQDGPVAERIQDTVLPAVRAALVDDPVTGRVRVEEDHGRTHGRGYYRPAALRIDVAGPSGDRVNLGDGGFTGWTAALLGDAKERCLTSCLATEALLRVASDR
jgi:hypothetical protein